MITSEVFAKRVEVHVLGPFTLADYKTLEELSDYRIRFSGPIDLLLDLTGMTNFTVDVALEELRYARSHAEDFVHVAIVSDDQWVTWGSFLSQFFVKADISVFKDEASAREWLDGTTPQDASPSLDSSGQKNS